ncbi:MAG: hypothetical protein Q9210_007329, partial [Variospora velana]
MVVLLDLDDDDGAFDPFARPQSLPGLQTPSQFHDRDDTVISGSIKDSTEDTQQHILAVAAAAAAAAAKPDRANPNLNHAFSTALACYPYHIPPLNPKVSQFSLHHQKKRKADITLSKRIVTLLTSSLDLNTLHALSLTCRQFRHNLLQHRSLLIRQTVRCANDLHPSTASPLGTKRTVGPCARDLVSPCRRCALT